MRPIAQAVVLSGLVNDETLHEFRRWGFPLDVTTEERSGVLKSRDEIIYALQEALESSEQVEMPETDLDLLRFFLNPTNQREGRLVLRSGDEKVITKILYSVAATGDYIIPYRSESITDLLTNHDSYLLASTDGRPRRVYFANVREVYYGEKKAFLVSTPDAAEDEAS